MPLPLPPQATLPLEPPCRPSDALRLTIATFVYTGAFDALSFAFTLWACLNLALDEPWVVQCQAGTVQCSPMGWSMVAYLRVADTVITAFFCLEVGLKATAQGVWGPPGSFAFLRSRWNVLDVVIAATSVAGLAVGQQTTPSGPPLRSIRVIKALRSLRGLRLLRASALASIIDTLYFMLPSFGNSLLLVLLFMYIFAVIGLQSFAGTQNVCNDFSVGGGEGCTGNFTLSGRNCAFLPTPALELACKAMGAQSNFTFPRLYESLLREWVCSGWIFNGGVLAANLPMLTRVICPPTTPHSFFQPTGMTFPMPCCKHSCLWRMRTGSAWYVVFFLRFCPRRCFFHTSHRALNTHSHLYTRTLSRSPPLQLFLSPFFLATPACRCSKCASLLRPPRASSLRCTHTFSYFHTRPLSPPPLPLLQ